MKIKRITNSLLFISVIVIIECVMAGCGSTNATQTTNAQQYNPESDFEVIKTSNGKSIEIKKYIGKNQTVNIPPRIKGLPVTIIRLRTFSGDDNITNVIIPDTVIKIEGEAFIWCSKLTSVTIGNGVTSIGQDVFMGCNNLTAINVDATNKVYSSDNGILYNNKVLLECPRAKPGIYTIPDGVTGINQYAFHLCKELKSIIIPDSVTRIGRSAFSGCWSLANITIGNGVTSIGQEAFRYCSSLTSVTIGNSVPNTAFVASYCRKDDSFQIFLDLYGIRAGAYERRNNQWYYN